MPYARIDDGIELYYELTGPEDGPVVLQFGGGLFGRHNFGFVNDGFRENGFRLLSFDARGYGASSSPREWYTIEGWADDGAKLLDALGLERVLVHGTSMGGMIAIAFTRQARRARDRGVRRRRVREAGRLPQDAVPRLAAHGRVDAVGRLLRPRHDAGGRRPLPRDRGGQANTFELVRSVIGVERPVHRAPGVHRDGGDGPLAARAADRQAAADDERHPRHPLPARAGAVRASAPGRWPRMNPRIRVRRVPRHRPRRPARVPGRRRPHRQRLLRGGVGRGLRPWRAGRTVYTIVPTTRTRRRSTHGNDFRHLDA